MPKGVEHNPNRKDLRFPVQRVKSSLMPKGVEHVDIAVIRWVADRVKSSLMPKGVEHAVAN